MTQPHQTKPQAPWYPTKVGPGLVSVDEAKAVGPQGQRTRERLRPIAAQLHVNLTGDNGGLIALRCEDGRDAGRIMRDIVEGRLPQPIEQIIEGEPVIKSVIFSFPDVELSNLIQHLAAIKMDYRLIDQKFNTVVEAPGGILPLPTQPISA